jgi:hypothetical protein
MARTTGKDHARINLDIWGNEDWLDLTPAAQHLYFVLWTSPQLSYCGCGDWHPGKIAAKAKGWTVSAVHAAAAEMSRALFLIIDTDTDEFILRSWIKHDGLWRIPNMAVSMANARADLASRVLRAVIVHEVSKLKSREPELSGWARDTVVNMLSQTSMDPANLPPYTPPNPGTNPTVNPNGNPPSNPAANGYANPTVNPPANPGATPAPAPAPTSTPKEGGYVSSPTHQSTPTDPPPLKCSRHINDPNPPNCGACADARRARLQWEANSELERAADELEQRRQGAEARQRAIGDCELCDEDGYRSGIVCDHVDRTQTAANGMAAVQAALKGKR